MTAPSQQQLKSLYLSALRQRFKNEINRLTSGATAALLAAHPETTSLSFPISYLYGWHWLRHHSKPDYISEILSTFRKRHAFLMDLLSDADTPADFLRGYIDHWADSPEGPVQRQQLLEMLARRGNDRQQLTAELLSLWQSFGLFSESYRVEVNKVARRERERYGDTLSDNDRARLALIDAMPTVESTQQLTKLGVIPAMGCPQTCRHCMFIWRPLMKQLPDEGNLYQQLSQLSDNVLFTGGDLSNHLDHFYRAIAEMKRVRTFAILLNGDFANDRPTTEAVLLKMAAAVRKRPRKWPKAKVLLQISFDEFHQEVVINKKGLFEERIPVDKIANIVELAPKFPEIQLCLLHKQTALNFSMDIFQKGVFNRLAQELGARGHQIQLLSTAPAERTKQNPNQPSERGQVIKDASFVLSKYPKNPILFTSSTIDSYGRAELMDAGEAVQERDYLQQVLQHGARDGEGFDNDLMFWLNGWVSSFSAVHLSLGNHYEEGLETILQRHAKDPLLKALGRFDRRLLGYYSEQRDDLQQKIDAASSPHQLFHVISEESELRLHMTRRLLQEG